MSNWFKKYSYTNNPKLRAFCFPYAGGSANIFSGWSDHLPSNIDLFAIQAPGRGRRFGEKAIECLETKVKTLFKEIIPYADVPFIFIGHSNGALVAFELARELQKSGNNNLKHIVLSAKRAPQLSDIRPPIHKLPQQEFIARLREYEFTPEEVLANEDFMEAFSPMLRADFSISETYHYIDTPKLESNATIFWGKHDKDVPFHDILQWKSVIEGHIDFVEFAEGHFFIHKQEQEFLKNINAIISQLSYD